MIVVHPARYCHGGERLRPQFCCIDYTVMFCQVLRNGLSMETTKRSGFRVRSGKKNVKVTTAHYILGLYSTEERQEVIGEERRTGQGKEHKVA